MSLFRYNGFHLFNYPDLSFLSDRVFQFDRIALSDSPFTLSRLSKDNLAYNAAFDFLLVPMPQAGSSKIAFTSNRDGSTQIYVMNVDGSAQTRLTYSSSNDDFPRWSPNGAKILFQTDRNNPATGYMDIYVMNSNGSGQTRLTSDPNDDSAAVWSPDGSKIVFQSFRNGVDYQVYLMNADGSNQINLTNSNASDGEPSWSPNGTKIAFASDRDHAGTDSIYVMNSNGSGQTRLTFSADTVDDTQPVWSRDGSKIAFVSTRDSTVETWQETDDNGNVITKTRLHINKEIYVMNADGTNQTRLTNNLGDDDSPNWSADGTKIIFRSDRDRDCCDPTAQVWMMNSDGSNQTNLSNNQFGDYGASLTSGANQPPVANAGGPYSGITGTAVQFSGSSSFDPDGTIASYSWNFGDNNSGSGATPTHTYATAGTYTVTLTVTDNLGATNSASTTATISNRPPVANAGGPYTGVTGTAVQFNGNSSSDPDGTIASYAWNFGDSNSGSGATPTHSYATAGTYTVTLTVTDNLGATNSASTTATISNRPPVANAGGSYSGIAGQGVQFNGGGSFDPDGSIASYSWNFGDGGTGSGVSSTHAYSSPGTYTITLTVTDNLGAQGSATTTANISSSSSDQFLQNFNQWALLRQPHGDEASYWTDILRAAYAHGQGSMMLALREMGKTVFESAEYAGRNRSDHDYVYDLYKTYLMRNPDQPSWDAWTSVVASIGRDHVRRGFDESLEFSNLVDTLTANGSPSSAVSSLVTARGALNNQSGNQLLARDCEWNVGLLSLPGRAGLDLGLGLSYSSLAWTRSGPYIYFDEDEGSPSPGFRLGFATMQEKFFDVQTTANVYLLITSSGRRVELRQVGTSNVYEAADSSYLQLIDYGSSLLVRTTDGTQMSYAKFEDEWRCTLIEDRNGNLMNVSYDWRGDITNITDTLGRVITFNYDGNANLISITQSWTVNGTAQTHTWASFGWGTLTMQPSFPSFPSLAVVGTHNGEAIPVLTQVGFDDGSRYNFEYTVAGQVNVIRRYTSDNVQRSYVAYDYATIGDDCPRITNSRVWAENWTGINGLPSEAVTQFSDPGDGSHLITAPDGTIYKEFYGSSWQNGLVTQSEVWSGGVRQKWTTASYTQDNTSVNYQTNPRVIEADIYDSAGNRRRTTIDYGPYAQYGLPYLIKEYAADGVTEIRHNYTDYNLSQPYLDRRIIGLVSAIHVSNTSEWQTKITYGYDDPTRIQSQAVTAPGHDQSYDASFLVRGNVTSVSRWDVTDINNASKALTSQISYDAAGSFLTSSDPLGHQNSIGYSDSFSDLNNGRGTFAYPTTLTDADGYSSSIQYNFDFGAKTRVQGPPPDTQPNGIIQTLAYDNALRVQQVTTVNNGAYTRYVYGPNYTQSFSTVNSVADEAYAIQSFDGLGRVIAAVSNHPGSTGGYKAQLTQYDAMGRAMKQSNPTEIDGSWNPAGDDLAGWLYAQQTYDWKGRPRITTNPDGTQKSAVYSACGCAGSEVTTLTDEVGRQQQVYSDVFGRTAKTEVLNWDGSVYATMVNTFNARNQATQVRQYQGGDQSGIYQDTTTTFDGYGRLQTKHVPEQNAGTATTYSYNNDDTVNSVTDARGASATYSYNNNRHLVTGINYSAPYGVSATPNVSFAYDAAGNRTSMTDGLGSASYNYNQLSQMMSETRTFNGVGTYSLSYGYNLAGELKTVTDPWGETVNYSFDSVGRLSSVGGSGFGSVSQFAANMQYRAWGTMKSATMGNGVVESAGYNSRLQMTSLQIQQPNGVNGAASTYQYYDDGQLRFSHSVDNRFDRAFSYDHAARVSEAYSGSEARDYINGTNSGTPTGAYRQSYQYSSFDQVTQQADRYWSASGTTTSTFANNRLQGWSYDADGEVANDGSTNYTWDVEGRVTQSGNSPSFRTVKFDGDGRSVRTSVLFTSNNTEGVVTYYLNSSVLGSAIAKLNVYGQRIETYIYGGGGKLATANSYSGVLWSHTDPVTGSHGISEAGGFYWSDREFNADGIDVGLDPPQPESEVPNTEFVKLTRSSGCGMFDLTCTSCAFGGSSLTCAEVAQLQRVYGDRFFDLPGADNEMARAERLYVRDVYSIFAQYNAAQAAKKKPKPTLKSVHRTKQEIEAAKKRNAGVGNNEGIVGGVAGDSPFNHITFQHMSRQHEEWVRASLPRLFTEKCTSAFHEAKLKSPAEFIMQTGLVFRPASDLDGHLTIQELGLVHPETRANYWSQFQGGAYGAQGGTITPFEGNTQLTTDGRAQIYLNDANAYSSYSFWGNTNSFEDVITHEMMHGGGAEPTTSFWPPFGPGNHDLAGFPGYSKIIDACK